jgi:hypothetical protein
MGYTPFVEPATPVSSSVVEYLRLEAPLELERLESLDHLVHSWADWGSAGEQSRQASYSAWLRATYRMFQRPALA